MRASHRRVDFCMGIEGGSWEKSTVRYRRESRESRDVNGRSRRPRRVRGTEREGQNFVEEFP